MEWTRPPPIISLPIEVGSAPARPPPPPPPLDLPDIEMSLSQIAALVAEVRSLPDPVFDDTSPIELQGNEWRLYLPPPELLLLAGDEPEEVREAVREEAQGLMLQRKESLRTPEDSVVESGLEMVLGEYTGAHSSSGTESTDAGFGSGLFRDGPSSRPGSSLGIRSPRSLVTTASSGTGSGTPSVKRRRPAIFSSRQRDVKHALVLPGVLLYSPYYTASPPSDSGPQHSASPRTEAIRTFFKNRKAQSECASCLEDHLNKKLTILTCQHRYCGTCLRTLINTAVTDEALFPPRCCLNEIPEDVINSTLRRSERSVYQSKAAEYKVPWGNRTHCPNPSCSAWIPPSAFQTTQCEIRCRKCRHKLCRYCKRSAHAVGSECPEDTGIAAVIDVAHRYGWRRCYNCHAVVERSSGCRHITCRCKAEFCYICGAKWRTCACTGSEAVANRPQLTADNEAEREQEEIRAAIAAAEEAERQEAEERMRAEIAERIEHERRLQSEREAREREAANLREEISRNLESIQERYDVFRTALDGLQGMQSAHIKSRHQTEEAEFIQNWRISVSRLADQIYSRLEEFKDGQTQTMASFKNSHEEELSSLKRRHEEEEDEYWFSLQRHLRGKPNREERTQALTERMKTTQELEMKKVQKRQESEVQAWRRGISADCGKALKVFATRKKIMEMETEENVGDMMRKWVAEEAWMVFIDDARRRNIAAKESAEEQVERARMVVAEDGEPAAI